MTFVVTMYNIDIFVNDFTFKVIFMFQTDMAASKVQ